ncbi:MAG: type 4a pilus biogenesis protein PilO [Shewanella sp.]
MKFDIQQFNDLDFENVGGWSFQVKAVFATVLAVLVCFGGYFLFISDARENLARVEQQELDLREDFKNKYRLAANLVLYREQLIVMEEQFAELLQMLPSKNEMPGLLDDLTFVATDSGLKINSLNWQPEVELDFYLEFPINMSVRGDYHMIGKMAAGVAKLPRIVSLHDFTIIKQESGELEMNIQAKTYRFKEGAELPQNAKGVKP